MAISVSVDYINPFLIASTSVLRDMCAIEAKLGKPYRKDTAFSFFQAFSQKRLTNQDKYCIISLICGI